MLITPSLYAANSRMESLNSNMKAVLITPLVSSLELGWRRKRSEGKNKQTNKRIFDMAVAVSHFLGVTSVYLEIQQRI